MKCPTCHLDLNFADEDQKRIEYCPSCCCVWAFSGKLRPAEEPWHEGSGQSDAVPGCEAGGRPKLGWDGRIGGLYLLKRKRHAALESLFYFLSTAAKRSF